MNFRKDGQQLYLDLPGYTSVELKPAGKDEFVARPIYRRYVFNREADGSVVSVTVNNIDKLDKTQPQLALKI